MTESLTSPCATLGGTPSREEVAHDIGYRVLWAANFGSFTDLRKVAREAADFLHSKPESAPLEDCEPYMREPYRSALSETPRIDDQEINHLALKVIYSLPAPMLPSHREDSIRILEAALRDVCARSATPCIGPYTLPSTEEVERTMKDAARYRWLRSEAASTEPRHYIFWDEFNAKLCREEKMDALIDAEMASKEPDVSFP